MQFDGQPHPLMPATPMRLSRIALTVGGRYKTTTSAGKRRIKGGRKCFWV